MVANTSVELYTQRGPPRKCFGALRKIELRVRRGDRSDSRVLRERQPEYLPSDPLEHCFRVKRRLARNGDLYPLVVTTYKLDARDRPGLLFTMMRTFASDHSRIAFEGNLASTELYRLEGASYEETEILKRATIAPRLDFVVLPLIAARLVEIRSAIQSKIAFAGNRGIIHVQIEADGELAFAACDNFHSDSVVLNGTIDLAALDDLVKTRMLRSYAPVPRRGSE